MPCSVSLLLSAVTDWCRWTRQRWLLCFCIWFLWFWRSVQHTPYCFCVEHVYDYILWTSTRMEISC